MTDAEITEMLNRRATIENYLINCSIGKRPLPDESTCAKLAVRLGTPKEYWPGWVKETLPK